MSLTNQTEKSRSKEKKTKGGSKEEVRKAGKAKETSTVANPLEREAPPRQRSKKDTKILATTTSKTLDSITTTSPAVLPSTSEKTGKKPRTKSDGGNTSIHPKNEDLVLQSNKPPSKKRAREEPVMDNDHAVRVNKKKRLDQDRSETAQKQPTTQKRVARSSSPVLSGSEDDSSGENVDAEDVYLHGFSTDEDSSDEESMDRDPLDVKILPSKAKDDARVKQRLDAAKKKPVLFSPSCMKTVPIFHSGCGQGRFIYWPNTSWILRGTNEGVFFAIWDRHEIAARSKQKGN